MSLIAMPKINFLGTLMYVEIRDTLEVIDTLNIIREVASNIDCNAPWLKDRQSSYNSWVDKIAEKSTVGMRKFNKIRNVYKGNQKEYPDIVISGEMVVNVINWLNTTYNISLYNYSRVENSPTCPACGSNYVLTWTKWGKYDNWWRLMWCCPEYKKTCLAVKKETWKHLSPEIVHIAPPHKIFFHDYERDGSPIPESSLMSPLTEWTLHKLGNSKQMILPKKEVKKELPKEVVSQPTFSGFSNEQLDVIRKTYEREGPAGFFRTFHDARNYSWDDIEAAAKLIGVAPA